MKNVKLVYLSEEKGTTLIVALLVMAILTAIGLAGIYTSSVGIMIASNFKKAKERFYTAESGLELGINYLSSISADQWSAQLLNGATKTTPDVILANPNHLLIGNLQDIPLNKNRFTVRVRNNPDDPAFNDPNLNGYNTDKDNTLILTSTCTAESGLAKCLETEVKWTPKGANSYGGKDITSDNLNLTEGKITW